VQVAVGTFNLNNLFSPRTKRRDAWSVRTRQPAVRDADAVHRRVFSTSTPPAAEIAQAIASTLPLLLRPVWAFPPSRATNVRVTLRAGAGARDPCGLGQESTRRHGAEGYGRKPRCIAHPSRSRLTQRRLARVHDVLRLVGGGVEGVLGLPFCLLGLALPLESLVGKRRRISLRVDLASWR
jgi:hypothetical protein